jgi:hypothetical protein
LKNSVREYVKNIEETCGDEREYVVILKHDKQEEALQKIVDKGKVLSTVAGALIKVKYKNKDLRMVGNKILIKNIQSIDEAKNLLNELFK